MSDDEQEHETADAGAPTHDETGAHEHQHGEACTHDHEHEHHGDEAQAGAGRTMPEPSLQLHIFHLASQVTMALGEIENPLSGKREKDLPTARFLIDLITMLEQKTAGNRTEEEDGYLRGVLTNLRMAYVAKSK